MAVNPFVPRPIDLPAPPPTDGEALDRLDTAKIIGAPQDPAARAAWRRALHRWRNQARSRTHYRGDLYRRPELAWTRSCSAVGLVWLWDETLYDHESMRFTPQRFLELAGTAFGGFDGVVLWHAYPVIGIDDRNQFDFYRDVPGLPDLVETLQAAGVRVFLDYNPWDVGTRREPCDDAAAMAALLDLTGADGVFLDTMREGGSFATRLAELAPRPVALEGESSVPLERIEDHALSWAQWCADTETPGVLRAHWFERGHQMHQTRRWNRDHSDELHTAWLNGCGMLVWESVFGAWVGWSARDRWLQRALVQVQRRFSRLLLEGDWTPLAGDAPGPIFWSRFELEDEVLWLGINRSAETVTGSLPESRREDERFFDLLAGVEIDAPVTHVPPRGFAALLKIRRSSDTGLEAFLEGRRTDPFDPDTHFPARVPRRLPFPDVSAASPPAGMVRIHGGSHRLEVEHQVRETGIYGRAPFVEEWKPLFPRLHSAGRLVVDVALKPFAIAELEVSAGEYREFLEATGHGERAFDDSHGAPRIDDAPVTGIDISDARAYARWKGLRLPTEHEWQVAGERGALRRREPVVWNWTESVHSDGRTRWSVLKGGSAFVAEGSEWYFPGGPRPPGFSAAYLHLGLGLNRSRQVGFRCAVTLEDPGDD